MIDLLNEDIRHEYMAERLRMDIAYQLRMLRLQRNMSKKQLSSNAGIPVEIIADIENWDTDLPNMANLKQIAKVLDAALLVRFTGWEGIVSSMIPEYYSENPISSTESPVNQ